MGFNVDAFREAHRPWSFTVGGKTFGARHVSAPDCQRFDRMRVAAGIDAKKHMRAIWWILRRAFPWRPSYMLRGDPVKIILALEPAARGEAMADFFGSLQGLSPTTLQKTANGTRSSARTPLRTA